MTEQDPTRITLTLNAREREALTRALVMAATILDAVDKHEDARVVLRVWEAVAPGGDA